MKQRTILMGLGGVLAVTLLVSLARAADFPAGPADDATTSLGSFRVYIMPQYRGLLSGYPGYSDSTFKLQSPTLYDPNTVIGRSNPHTHGSAPDASGTAVGTAGTLISDTAFTLVPPTFQGPPGTAEVHTEVHRLYMELIGGGGPAVRAGIAAPTRPISPGEVESLNVPPDDFPAESFFDVFVEVDLPASMAWPGGTVYNVIPLLVGSSNLTEFPPHVIYTHENSTAVPVLFKTANPPYWNANDLLGYLVLAGHGVNYNDGQTAEFEDAMALVPEMPLPPNVPTVTHWGLIAMTALLIGAAVMVFRTRRRQAPTTV